MEDSVAKDQSSAHGRSASRLLRYPLRSGTKMKEEKPPVAESSNSSAPKRERLASSVSKSVGVLDISGKEKSAAKPPRRLSIPSKSNASPALKSFGNITPTSEARGRRPSGSQGRSDTPISAISKSSGCKKFSVLSSASYWLSQIKLSESASKHTVSIGFFKLALEAGCEPIQRMSDELISYVRRHNNAELSESVKELFESYNISESFDQLQISGTCSQVPSECNQLNGDDVRSSISSITDNEKLQSKSIGADTDEICQVQKVNTESVKKNDLTKKTQKSTTESMASSKSGSEIRGRSMQKKPQKPMKQESAKDKDKVKKQGRKSTRGGGPLNSPPEEARQENKENMDVPQMEETVLTEV